MPPKGKKTQNKDDVILSKENILKLVESQMSGIFETQYEELKDKLITLMAREVSKLQNKVQNIEQEFETFKTMQISNATAIVESNEELDALQNRQKKKTDTLIKNIEQIAEQLNGIQCEIDETKQILREKNVRLVGLEEDESQESNGELKNKIVEFSRQQLEIPNLDTDDIEEVNRLGQKNMNKHRDIIIRFKHKDTRDKFYRRRRNLYDRETRRSLSGIYINEDLTPYRQRLYFDTRNLRKKTVIFAVWTSSGTIMVKLRENSAPTPIHNHRDLANLLRQNQIDVQDDQ